MLGSNFGKFLMPILKRRADSSTNFVSLFSFMKDDSSVLFSSDNIYFAQKEPVKMNTVETFNSLGQNSSHSSCPFWNGKLIPLQILHHSSFSWHITPLWILISCFSYFGLNPNFETLNCSENLSYSSCHSPNHKSIFLQILHHHSVSGKITPLYFFRSNIKYFAQFSL